MKHHITRSCNRLVQVVVPCETASWFYGFCEIGQFAKNRVAGMKTRKKKKEGLFYRYTCLWMRQGCIMLHLKFRNSGLSSQHYHSLSVPLQGNAFNGSTPCL